MLYISTRHILLPMRFLSLSSNTLRNLLGPTSISPLFQSNSLVFCFYLFVIIYFRYDNFLFSSINLRNLFQPTSFSKRPPCYIYTRHFYFWYDFHYFLLLVIKRTVSTRHILFPMRYLFLSSISSKKYTWHRVYLKATVILHI